MVKFPYVQDYSLFSRVDISVAEELLSEYNDFYIYNMAQYQNLFLPTASDSFPEKSIDGGQVANSDNSENSEQQPVQDMQAIQREQAIKSATDHFAKIFGSKDFAESTLVGLKISFYDLQQILLEEYKSKIPAEESAVNPIAKQLRCLASILVFAERVTSGLSRLEIDIAGLDEQEQPKVKANNEKVRLALEFIKEGFELLLEQLTTQNLNIPEYHIMKEQFAKMKTVNAYIDFCEKLFFNK